jgi:hypothetical protein
MQQLAALLPKGRERSSLCFWELCTKSRKLPPTEGMTARLWEDELVLFLGIQSFLISGFAIGCKLNDKESYGGKQKDVNKPTLMKHKFQEEPKKQ